MMESYDTVWAHPTGIWYQKLDHKVWCERRHIQRINFSGDSMAISMVDGVNVWLKLPPEDLEYLLKYFGRWGWPDWTSPQGEDADDEIPF
jgi:hypothetical protein